MGDRDGVLPAEGAQTTLLLLEGEGGRSGDVGRGIKNRQVVPHHHCLKSFQPSWRPFLSPSQPVAAPSLLRENLPLDFLPFLAYADAELSVSMLSQAGFGRIIGNFSAGPCTCNLILGK